MRRSKGKFSRQSVGAIGQVILDQAHPDVAVKVDYCLCTPAGTAGPRTIRNVVLDLSCCVNQYMTPSDTHSRTYGALVYVIGVVPEGTDASFLDPMLEGPVDQNSYNLVSLVRNQSKLVLAGSLVEGVTVHRISTTDLVLQSGDWMCLKLVCPGMTEVGAALPYYRFCWTVSYDASYN